jgi:hypothetical protein
MASIMTDYSMPKLQASVPQKKSGKYLDSDGLSVYWKRYLPRRADKDSGNAYLRSLLRYISEMRQVRTYGPNEETWVSYQSAFSLFSFSRPI